MSLSKVKMYAGIVEYRPVSNEICHWVFETATEAEFAEAAWRQAKTYGMTFSEFHYSFNSLLRVNGATPATHSWLR